MRGSPGGRAGVVMFLFAAFFLLLAAAVPKPWDSGVQRRIEARIQKGQALRPEDHAARLLFWVALVNAAGCAGLGLTARWWAAARPARAEGRDSGEEPGESVFGVEKSAPRGALLWGGLVLLAGLAVALRWPLAVKSLWWDEAWTVRQVVVGERVADEDAPGGERFVKRNWARTAWYYAKPTNHAGFSVLSRLCNDAWRRATGAPEWAFAEWAVRLPSLLASAGAVILIGMLGRALVGGWAGLIAAFLLAVHPWFIRYGVDARAFGLNVLFSLILSLSFYRIITTRGSWPALAAFGAAAFALLFTFPYNAYLPVAFACVLLGGVVTGLVNWRVFLRFAVAGAVAAMFFVQAAAPWAPQALGWTDVQGERMAGPRLDGEGLAQTWASFLTGTPLRIEEQAGEGCGLLPALGRLFEKHIWLAVYFWGGLPVLLVCGFLVLAVCRLKRRQGPASALLAGGWILSLLLPLGVALWKQHYYYERYLIYALPGVVIGVVAGAFWLAGLIPWKFRESQGVRAAGALVLLAPLLFLQQPQRELLLERPYAPARDVAEYLKGLPPEDGSAPLAVGYGFGANVPALYHPRVQLIKSRDELVAVLRRAGETRRPLYVYYGYSSFNRLSDRDAAKEGFQILDNPELFEVARVFAGIEPAFCYRVLRYTGKPVDSASLPR